MQENSKTMQNKSNSNEKEIQEKINFLEISEDIVYLQSKIITAINQNAIAKHLPPKALIKLELIEKCTLPDTFACIGIIPSIEVDGDVKIVRPTLFNLDDEIWLYDSKLQPYKKIENSQILDWIIGVGAFAKIILDGIEMIVNTSSNKNYLESRANLTKTKDGTLIADYLAPPIKICIPLKARVFEVGGVYEVVKIHNERGSYFEPENEIFVDTGILVDVKVNDKDIIKNVVCNSKLESLISTSQKPIKFKILDKKELSKGKIKVILMDANKTTKKVILDDLDLI